MLYLGKLLMLGNTVQCVYIYIINSCIQLHHQSQLGLFSNITASSYPPSLSFPPFTFPPNLSSSGFSLFLLSSRSIVSSYANYRHTYSPFQIPNIYIQFNLLSFGLICIQSYIFYAIDKVLTISTYIHIYIYSLLYACILACACV